MNNNPSEQCYATATMSTSIKPEGYEYGEAVLNHFYYQIGPLKPQNAHILVLGAGANFEKRLGSPKWLSMRNVYAKFQRIISRARMGLKKSLTNLKINDLIPLPP